MEVGSLLDDIQFRMAQPDNLALAPQVSSTSDVKTPESSNDLLPKEISKNSLDSDKPKASLVHDTFPPLSSILVSANDPSPTAPIYAPLDTAIIERDLVAPFLQTLTPGAGFRCIALLLFNHLLRDGRGYDARVRHSFKRLAVIVLSHEFKVGGILSVELDDDEDLDALLWGDKMRDVSGEKVSLNDTTELALLATRKFEALEHAIAARLISMSAANDTGTRIDLSRSNGHKQSPRSQRNASSVSTLSSSTHGRIDLAPKEASSPAQYGMSREQLIRGIKVGTAGAVGATLFALTGGLAAPGIAAGLAAVGTSLSSKMLSYYCSHVKLSLTHLLF